MTVHHFPSPDRIIEANRPRDWFDAHADYAMTGDAVYRAERLAHERGDVPAQTEGTGVLTYLIGAVLIVAAILLGIPAVCLAWVWTGGLSL